MSDHLIDEIANDLNGRRPPDKGDIGGVWVFLITLGLFLMWRYL